MYTLALLQSCTTTRLLIYIYNYCCPFVFNSDTLHKSSGFLKNCYINVTILTLFIFTAADIRCSKLITDSEPPEDVIVYYI